MPFTNRTIAAAATLALSCFVIANTVTRSQPISIVIEGETVLAVHTPVVYQQTEVIAIMISSFTAGVSAIHLYLEASKKPLAEPARQALAEEHRVEPPQKLKDLNTVTTALRVLRGPRRKILKIIVDKEGEALQKDLYLETGFSKAKISRTLDELEARNLIQRKRYGNTKKIVLSDWMREGTASNREKHENQDTNR